MSKYKLGFYVNSGANAFSGNYEVVDLVEDYDYTEEEAKQIIQNEKKLKEIFEEWLWETVEIAYSHLKTEEEIENWK